MVGFIFGGDTQETPDSIKRKRELVRALMGAQGAPRNIGEGLNALGDGIVANVLDRRADKAEKAGTDSANSAFAPIISALSGMSGSTGIPSPGASGELGQSSPSPSTPVQPGGIPEVSDYIKQGAVARGMDPNVVLRVAGHEGLNVFDPSKPDNGGDEGSSFGPFQLHYAGKSKSMPNPGLGDEFTKATGLHASDPSTWKQQIDFSLDWARKHGWSPWMGAKAEGITGMMGIGDMPPQQPAQVASLDPAAGMQAPQPIQPPPVNAPAPPPTPGYVDPRISTEGRAPMQGPTQPAPQLPAPTTIANAPQVAAQPPVPAGGVQQVAQVMAAKPQGSGVDIGQIQQALSNPFLSPGQRAVANALLEQELGRRNTAYEQQLKQQDPKYQMDLQKGQLELEQLRNPKISPADQANIDLNKEKFAFEQNKPTEVNGRLIGRDGKVVYDSPMSAADEARLKLDRDKFNAEIQKGQWQKLTDGRLYNETTGEFRDAPPAAPGSVPPKFDDVSGMRKEIQQLPSYKNLAAAAPIYKSMAETAGRNSKASDLNLVYGLGKIMDPTSVVREGEMIMVKNTASLPDWLQGAISSLNGGAALTPETRQAIMTEAFGRVKGYNDEFQQNMGQYQGIVQRNGINPADVIPEIDKFEPWSPPAAAPTTPSGPIGTDWRDLSPGVRIRRKVQ